MTDVTPDVSGRQPDAHPPLPFGSLTPEQARALAAAVHLVPADRIDPAERERWRVTDPEKSGTPYKRAKVCRHWKTRDRLTPAAAATHAEGGHLFGWLPGKTGFMLVDVDRGVDRVAAVTAQYPPRARLRTGKGLHLLYVAGADARYPRNWEVLDGMNRPVSGETIYDRGYAILWDPAGLLAALESDTPAPAPPASFLERGKARAKPAGPAKPPPDRRDVSPEEVADALAALPVDLEYDDWLSVGMALHSEGLPFAVYDDWSAASPKYGPKKTRQSWDSFGGRSGITIGTLFHLAAAHGYIRPGRRLAVPTEPATDPEQFGDGLAAHCRRCLDAKAAHLLHVWEAGRWVADCIDRHGGRVNAWCRALHEKKHVYWRWKTIKAYAQLGREDWELVRKARSVRRALQEMKARNRTPEEQEALDRKQREQETTAKTIERLKARLLKAQRKNARLEAHLKRVEDVETKTDVAELAEAYELEQKETKRLRRALVDKDKECKRLAAQLPTHGGADPGESRYTEYVEQKAADRVAAAEKAAEAATAEARRQAEEAEARAEQAEERVAILTAEVADLHDMANGRESPTGERVRRGGYAPAAARAGARAVTRERGPNPKPRPVSKGEEAAVTAFRGQAYRFDPDTGRVARCAPETPGALFVLRGAVLFVDAGTGGEVPEDAIDPVLGAHYLGGADEDGRRVS